MKIKIAIFFISLLIGYLIGVYLPPEILMCTTYDTPLTKGEYYGNIINIIVAIGTIGAVIVALFQNEIRELYKKVKFEIELDSKEINEDLNDSKGPRKATKYYNSILIRNIGNINARNCELYLESCIMYNNNQSIPIATENFPIDWNKEKNEVYIPIQGKKTLTLFSLIGPQELSMPDKKDEKTPAHIEILGVNDIENKGGRCRWELIYSLNSTNAKPKRVKFVIDWDGGWEERQKEMKNKLKVTKEEL